MTFAVRLSALTGMTGGEIRDCLAPILPFFEVGNPEMIAYALDPSASAICRRALVRSVAAVEVAGEDCAKLVESNLAAVVSR